MHERRRNLYYTNCVYSTARVFSRLYHHLIQIQVLKLKPLVRFISESLAVFASTRAAQ